MIPEERRDGPGTGEESTRLQAAGSVRKVSVPAGQGGVALGRGRGTVDPTGFSRPSAMQDSQAAASHTSLAPRGKLGIPLGKLRPGGGP